MSKIITRMTVGSHGVFVFYKYVFTRRISALFFFFWRRWSPVSSFRPYLLPNAIPGPTDIKARYNIIDYHPDPEFLVQKFPTDDVLSARLCS